MFHVRYALIVLLMSVFGVSAEATNYASNSSFETGMGPWEWGVSQAQATGRIDATVRHSGARSFCMTNRSPYQSNVYCGVAQPIRGLKPNTTYRISLWCKGDNVGCSWFGGGPGWLVRGPIPTGTYDWQYCRVDCTTPADLTTFELRINVDGETRALWIDDVAIEEVPSSKAPRAYDPVVLKAVTPSLRFYPALYSSDGPIGPVMKVRAEDDGQYGGDVRLGWSESGLVCDVLIAEGASEKDREKQARPRSQCVRIGVDARQDSALSANACSAFAEFDFSVNDAGQVTCVCSKPVDAKGGNSSQASGVAERRQDGWLLHVVIPWGSLGIDPQAIPESLRMNIVVSDPQDERRCATWTAGMGEAKDSRVFATVVLPRKEAGSVIGALDVPFKQYDANEYIPMRYMEYALRDVAGGAVSVSIKGPAVATKKLTEATLPGVSAGTVRMVPLVACAEVCPKDGTYTVSVEGGSTLSPTMASVCRIDMTTRVQSGLKEIVARREAIRNALNEKARSDAYVQMGLAIADRFVERVQTGGPKGDQLAQWSLLQVNELAYVLDRVQERAEALASSLPAYALPAEPSILGGYGHFESVERDIPIFRQFGATLVQQERGPNRLNADGSNTIDILPTFRKAAQSGMKIDLLLSPHYFPQWAVEASPDVVLPAGVSGVGAINIDHPKAREVFKRWLETIVPIVKDEPALFSLNLSNEPTYGASGRDPYSRPRWVQYLKDTHRTIESLNALYGKKYASFEEVPVPSVGLPIGVAERRAYYDWVVFNQKNFADWHRWMNDIVKGIAPGVKTHCKPMAFIFDHTRMDMGLDPELICNTTDLAGNDCWSYLFPGGEYIYDWPLEEMWYDLLHSFRGQAVFNSENHLIRDDSPAETILPEHTRSVLWQGGLHHVRATTIWVWEEPRDRDLCGSIYFRPGNIYAAGQAMLDMNRLSAEVDAISQAQPQIAMLYSIPSIFWQSDYCRVAKQIHASGMFSGQAVTFVSERQLAAGQTNGVKWIILPHVTHISDSAMVGLTKFVAGGGKVIFVGDECLAWNEYHQPRTLPNEIKACPKVAIVEDNRVLATELRKTLAAGGLEFVLLSEKNQPAWGVEYRVVRQKDRTLVSMNNLLTRPMTVSLALKGRAVDLLSHNRSVELNAIRLEPMVPVLLDVRP